MGGRVGATSVANAIGATGRLTMKELILDGTGWLTKDDVYDAFFRAVDLRLSRLIST